MFGSIQVVFVVTNPQGLPLEVMLGLASPADVLAFVSQTAVGAATWDTRLVANGPYTLQLTVIDAAGRVATSAIAVNVHNLDSSGSGPGEAYCGPWGVPPWGFPLVTETYWECHCDFGCVLWDYDPIYHDLCRWCNGPPGQPAQGY